MITFPVSGKPYVWATDFGMIGDDATDNFVAMQAWLSAAAGKTAYLSAGVYRFTIPGATPITIPSNTRLIGDGWNSVIKANWGAYVSGTGGGEGTGAILATSKTNIQVEGIRFTAYNRPATIATRNGYSLVTFNGSSHIIIRDCMIDGSGMVGIVNQGLQAAGTGAADFLIQGCEVHDTYSDGIAVAWYGALDARAIGNNIYDWGDDGISADTTIVADSPSPWPTPQQPFRCVIQGNNIHGAKASGTGGGIGITGQQIICIGNTVQGTNADGLNVYDESTGGGVNGISADCVISGNTIDTTGVNGTFTGTGMMLAGLRDSQVCDNDIRLARTDGIRCPDFMKNVKFRGNKIYKCGGAGIFLNQVSSTSVAVLAQFFTAFNETETRAIIENIDIDGNTVFLNGTYGIIVSGEVANHAGQIIVRDNIHYLNNTSNAAQIGDLTISGTTNYQTGTNYIANPTATGGATWTATAFPQSTIGPTAPWALG